VASDRRIKDGLAVILESWSVCDLFEAHCVLDALDAAQEAEARRGAP